MIEIELSKAEALAAQHTRTLDARIEQELVPLEQRVTALRQERAALLSELVSSVLGDRGRLGELEGRPVANCRVRRLKDGRAVLEVEVAEEPEAPQPETPAEPEGGEA